MIRKLQTCLSAIVFLAVCFAGSVIDSSWQAAIAGGLVALAAVAGIAILERANDYLPEGR